LEVFTYHTAGNKDVIRTYLNGLEKADKVHGYTILYRLETMGISALDSLNTRQISGKVWEIKFAQHRIFYLLVEREKIYLLHACHKQKNKAEPKDIDIALRRAREIQEN